jgi:hypothetical protein
MLNESTLVGFYLFIYSLIFAYLIVGNWLRDYSQAVDVRDKHVKFLDNILILEQVGTVKMVSAEAIRLLLWILGFMSFGFGTKEFEVTRDRLGCYR